MRLSVHWVDLWFKSDTLELAPNCVPCLPDACHGKKYKQQLSVAFFGQKIDAETMQNDGQTDDHCLSPDLRSGWSSHGKKLRRQSWLVVAH